jgi:hypothetical protein
MFPSGGGGVASAGSAATVSRESVRFVDAVDADAFAATALSLAFDALPHLLGDAEALAASSLVARARVWSG